VCPYFVILLCNKEGKRGVVNKFLSEDAMRTSSAAAACEKYCLEIAAAVAQIGNQQ